MLLSNTKVSVVPVAFRDLELVFIIEELFIDCALFVFIKSIAEYPASFYPQPSI